MGKITKEDIEKLQLEEVKGEVLGMALKEDLRFVLEKEGLEGLKKVENEMEKWGYPLKYKEIKDFQWYPENRNLVLFVIQKTLDWSDEDMREMGRWVAKISFLARLMMKYFVSLHRVAQEVNNYWRKAHTTGLLEVAKLDEKEHILILELKHFNTIHPAHCRYLEGYFWQIASYVLPKESLRVKELECGLFANKSHKFKISW